MLRSLGHGKRVNYYNYRRKIRYLGNELMDEKIFLMIRNRQNGSR